MLLIGQLPQAITSPSLVILVYAVLIVMLASALGTVLVKSTLYAVAAYLVSMALLALLYLVIGPFLLFAIQLLVFAVSAALLLSLLRRTTGLARAPVSTLGRDWTAGAAVAAGLLVLLAVVAATTEWPVRIVPSVVEGFEASLSNTYVVGLAVVVVIVASAALGAGLLLATSPPGRRPRAEPEPGRRRPRSEARP